MGSLSELLPRLLEAPQEVAEQVARKIVKRYERRLLKVIKERLSQRVRQGVDPEDVSQETINCFLQKPPKVASGQDVWHWLRSVAVKRAINAARREMRHAGRNLPGGTAPEDGGFDIEQLEAKPGWVGREKSKRIYNTPTRQSASAAGAGCHPDNAPSEKPALVKADSSFPEGTIQQLIHGLLPEMATAIIEAIDHLVRYDREHPGQVSLRRVFSLSYKGHSREEIASQLGCSRGTVQRKLALIANFWQAG